MFWATFVQSSDRAYRPFQFHAAHFIERDKESHKDFLALIAEGDSMDSATYGINRTSPLLQLAGFDITNCLPFDVMHTIFEGIASNHLNVLLHHLIDSCHYLSLSQLNHVLAAHPYGYSESDTKPSPIRRDSTATSDFYIKSSGNMLLYLPLYFVVYLGCSL